MINKKIKTNILNILTKSTFEGNVFLYKEELINKLKSDINEDIDIDDYLQSLILDEKIKVVNGNENMRVYTLESYDMEYTLSNLLYRHKDKISIITGGPGTGKTYNIKKYIKKYTKMGYNILLCAPTGRAAKRITEVTETEAKTIHRALEFQMVEDEDGNAYSVYGKNEEDKLKYDLIIVDEMSMVDMSLMYHLMLAVKDETELLLVGDIDQLPSVGFGQVLRDMIDSKWFKVKTLKKIYRQEENGNIVLYSHKVNKGEQIDLSIDCEDFKFVRRNSDIGIRDAICKLVQDILPRHFSIEPSDIQVICPSKKRECGTDNLNIILQRLLNKEDKNKNEILIGDKIFRVDDKVMQIKNNYNLRWTIYDELVVKEEGYGVFNGDIGRIVDIDKDSELVTIMYDDREVIYNYEDLEDLSLGYAITVHKAQGSEYDVVVIPISYFPKPLLNRKILYTAMTRAKKCIIFIGYEDIFNTMIRNKYETKRNSALCDEFYIS